MLTESSPISTRTDRAADQQMADSTWRQAAACREWTGVDFFPFSEDAIAIRRVKDVCALCPVEEECLAYAIETRQTDGVWGGHTREERTYLRRRWMEETRALTETQRDIALTTKVSPRKEKASS
jgi:WhiB family redox-sensing transcriptional regulator